MTYRRLAVGVVLGMTAMSSHAAAQETRKLSFNVKAEVEHDTNVARSSASQAALRGLTPEDTVFTPSASVDLLLPVGRQSVFLTGFVGYSFYDKNEQLDRERIDLTGGANVPVGPCVATLTGGYARGLTQVDDPLLFETVENIQEVTRAGATVACIRGAGFGVTLGASQDWVSNDLARLRTSDYETTTLTAAVSYTRPALGTLSIVGTHQETEYPNRPLDNDGYELDSIGLSYERQLGARLQGSVSAGYTNVSAPTFGGGDDEYSTSIYSGSLSYRASSRLKFLAEFERGVTPSTGFTQSYDINTAYRLSADYEVGSRILLGAGAARVERDARGGIEAPLILLSDSKTDSIYGSIRYRQSDRLSFVLNVARDERTTNAPQFDYTSERIGLAAEMTF